MVGAGSNSGEWKRARAQKKNKHNQVVVSYTDEPDKYERIKKQSLIVLAVASAAVWIKSLYAQLHRKKLECQKMAHDSQTYAKRARELNLKLVAAESKIESLHQQLEQLELRKSEEDRLEQRWLEIESNTLSALLQAQEALRAQIDRVGPIQERFLAPPTVVKELSVRSPEMLKEERQSIEEELVSEASVAAASIEEEINALVEAHEMNQTLVDAKRIEMREWQAMQTEDEESEAEVEGASSSRVAQKDLQECGFATPIIRQGSRHRLRLMRTPEDAQQALKNLRDIKEFLAEHRNSSPISKAKALSTETPPTVLGISQKINREASTNTPQKHSNRIRHDGPYSEGASPALKNVIKAEGVDVNEIVDMVVNASG